MKVQKFNNKLISHSNLRYFPTTKSLKVTLCLNLTQPLTILNNCQTSFTQRVNTFSCTKKLLIQTLGALLSAVVDWKCFVFNWNARLLSTLPRLTNRSCGIASNHRATLCAFAVSHTLNIAWVHGWMNSLWLTGARPASYPETNEAERDRSLCWR